MFTSALKRVAKSGSARFKQTAFEKRMILIDNANSDQLNQAVNLKKIRNKSLRGVALRHK